MNRRNIAMISAFLRNQSSQVGVGLIAAVASTFLSSPAFANQLISQNRVPPYRDNSFPATGDGCYRIGNRRVVFRAQLVNSDNPNYLNSVLNSQPRDCSKGLDIGRSYNERMPSSGDQSFLLLSWKNIDSGRGDYIVVRNTPDKWLVQNTPLANNQTTYVNSETDNGYFVRFVVNNPPNNGDPWTSNHIIYRFYGW